MVEHERDNRDSRRGFDGVGCVGSLLVFAMMLAIMGAIMGGANPVASDAPATAVSFPARATKTRPALARVTAVPSPTVSNTVTPSPEPTHTATAPIPPSPTTAATATATLIPPPLSEPTTAVSPTATPPPLPTPHEVYSWTLRVPILMYHYISVPPEDADVYRTDLSVTPEEFRRQMAYLAENDYTTIDFYDLSRAIADKQELPPKPVILTFDDGYLDNYVNAFPTLQEYGLQGTFFIVTEFVDRGHAGYMSWPMIEEMARAGMRIESHSKSHPDLRDRERDFLIWEILGSQETIAAHIGYLPRYFSYPSGRYDENTIAILQELDFWGAVTTRGGKWHGFADRFEWTRLRVRNDTPLAEFIDLVDPADTVSGIRFNN